MKTSVISSIIIKVRVRARGRDLLPQAGATQGEDEKRDTARRNVGRFTLSGTSSLRHAETGFFCAADRTVSL